MMLGDRLGRRLRQRGATLVELMAELVVMGLILTLAAASIDSMLRREALRDAAREVLGILQATQSEAAVLSTNRAVKFIQRPEGWQYAIYEDRNGNGVSNAEIAKGIDAIVRPPRPLFDTRWVHIGLLAVETDPDGGPPLTSPVNFNASTLCSFSMTGTGTPGTVYLTDGSGAIAVRSSGDGSFRVLLYEPQTGRWRELS